MYRRQLGAIVFLVLVLALLILHPIRLASLRTTFRLAIGLLFALLLLLRR